MLATAGPQKDVDTGEPATQKGPSLELVMMSMQLSVTYCVICLDLRNPIPQRPTMMLPGQCFISLHNICFTFLLFTNVWSWLFACTRVSLLLPFLRLLQIALLFGRTRSFLSWTGLSIEENAERYQRWPLVCVFGCTQETGQRNALESFPILWTQPRIPAFLAGLHMYGQGGQLQM